ncbi:MAG TPA: hypothetical protein VN442_11705 [Bryobacteraceae bacterium]|nr:hypothetical protein [Bryobacteraceae bacterium]
MSKHKNKINPDYYKVRGGEPGGQDVIHEINRQQYGAAMAREKREDTRDAAAEVSTPEDTEAVAENAQTSVKMGMKSSAKKMQRRRHNLGPIPATSEVAGAFGRTGEEKEPEREEEEK